MNMLSPRRNRNHNPRRLHSTVQHVEFGFVKKTVHRLNQSFPLSPLNTNRRSSAPAAGTFHKTGNTMNRQLFASPYTPLTSDNKGFRGVLRSRSPHPHKKKTKTPTLSVGRKKRQNVAATKIQKTWRGFNSRFDYVIIRMLAVRIQSAMRRKLAMNKVKNKLHATQVLQRFGRNTVSKLVMERVWKERSKATLTIQHFSRLAIRKIRVAKLIQTMQNGLVWNSYASFQSLRVTRTRIAIGLLKHKTISPFKLLKILRNLEEATFGSEQCCRELVDAGVPMNLLAYVRNNCHKPKLLPPVQDMEMIQSTFRILANLSRYEDLRTVLLSTDKLMGLLLSMLYTDNHILFFKIAKFTEGIVLGDSEALCEFSCHAAHWKSVLVNKKAQWMSPSKSSLTLPRSTGNSNSKINVYRLSSPKLKERRLSNKAAPNALLTIAIQVLEDVLDAALLANPYRASF